MRSVLVIGAGAIGSYVAAQCAQAGLDVAIVARGARLAEIRSRGLLIEREGKVVALPVTALGWTDVRGLAELVVLCVKTCDLAGALDRLQPHIGSHSVVLTLQNGVDAPGEVAAHFPAATVVAARSHGFYELTHGVLRHVGVAPSFLLGHAFGTDRQAPRTVAALLTDAGIPCRVSDDIMRDLWEKLLLAAPLGGTGAALGRPAGQVLSDHEGQTLLRAAMEEVAMLARARGVALAETCVADTLRFIAGFPTVATTSLQRDLQDGGRSEYGSLIGAVLRMGEEHDLPLPAFARIDHAIRGRLTVLAT